MVEKLVPTTVYWDRPTWDLARSAYVADLDTLPSCPSAFLWWLHGCLEAHVDRTPAARADLRHRLPEPARASGDSFTRMHTLRADLVDGIALAIVRDRLELGEMVSVSQFCRDSVRAAAAATHARIGRDLPPAPARLVNNPRRPTVR